MSRERRFKKKLNKIYGVVFLEGMIEVSMIIYSFLLVYSEKLTDHSIHNLNTIPYLIYAVVNIFFPVLVFVFMTILYRRLRFKMRTFHWFEYKKHKWDMKVYYYFMSISNLIVQLLPMALVINSYHKNEDLYHWYGWD